MGTVIISLSLNLCDDIEQSENIRIERRSEKQSLKKSLHCQIKRAELEKRQLSLI